MSEERYNYIPYLNKAINNDEEAFNILFTAIKPMATFYALSICKDEYIANEAVQLSAIKMYQSLNTLNDLSSFEGWFKSIVRNTVFDLLRKQGKEINFTSFDNEQDEDFEYSIADERIDYQPEKYFDQKEKERLIQEIISDLDEKQRPIIMMYFFEGLKIREIASILDIPESTVKTRLTSGKNSIKEKVEYIQTRDGIKLYSITPLSFLLYLLSSYTRDYSIRNMPVYPSTPVSPTAASDLGHTGSVETAIRNTVSNSVPQGMTGHTASVSAVKATAAATTATAATTTTATTAATTVTAAAGVSAAAKVAIGAVVAITALTGGYTAYTAITDNDPLNLFGKKDKIETVDFSKEYAGMISTPDNIIILEDGSALYNEHQYMIVEDNQISSFDDALKYCNDDGGYMAVINNDNENKFLYNFMKAKDYDNAYFGYTDIYDDGNWRWVESRINDYSFWHSGEPSGINSFAMFTSQNEDGSWTSSAFSDNNPKVFLYEFNHINIAKKEDDGQQISTESQQQVAIPEVTDYNVGDRFTFGKYEQDGSSSDLEDIEWQVIDKDKNRILVISTYALETMPFHYTPDSVTWETCDVRTWLNSDFYDSAFSNEEKRSIILSTVTADPEPTNNTPQGNDTMDHVFLLSTVEARKYFPMESERICEGTPYLDAKNPISDRYGYVAWYVRTLYNNSHKYAEAVFHNGSITGNGSQIVTSTGFCLRPAMWIDLAEYNGISDPRLIELIWTNEVQENKTDAAAEMNGIRSSNIGDIVLFGTFEQDNNASNGKEQIEWVVLAKENGKALLMSEEALNILPYNSSYTDTTWENCSLRSWLNDEFYDSSFSSDEKKNVSLTTVKAENNSQYGTSGGNDTSDHVFILSADEVERYIPSKSDRVCYETRYAMAQPEGYEGEAMWWIRNPGYSNDRAACINNRGDIWYDGNEVNLGYISIRPCIWIDLN